MKSIRPNATHVRRVWIALLAAFVGLSALGRASDAATKPPSELLSWYLAECLGSILAPLGQPGFDQPQWLVDLKQSFADRMSQAPSTTKAEYQAAIQVCDALIGALDERANAGADLSASSAVHGSSTLGASHGWADRNILREGDQLAREKGERKKLQAEAKRTDAFFTASRQAAWSRRAVQLRTEIEGFYQRERETERQCEAAETAESRSRATTVYPQLAVADSSLNRDFLRRYQSLKAAGDPMLKNADWPETLAKLTSDALFASPPSNSQPPPSIALRPVVSETLDEVSVSLRGKGFTHSEWVGDLKQRFAEELGKAPDATKPVYQAALQVCDGLTATLEERAGAKAAYKVKSTASKDSAWLHRAAQLRAGVERLFEQERALENQAHMVSGAEIGSN